MDPSTIAGGTDKPKLLDIRNWLTSYACFRVATRALVLCVAGAGLCAVPPPALAAETTAEFALRWDARDGGPQSGEQALVALGIRVPRASAFAVDYYDLPPNPPVLPGFEAILRRRVDASGNAELTWKLRGDRAMPAWTCPLRNVAKSKSEADVTLGTGDTISRRYSYSCTSEDAEAAATELAATRKGCTVAMKRWTRNGLRVEEWRLPGGVRLIEVSRAGADTAADLDAFRRKIAAPLLAAGTMPIVNSKTELGSNCKIGSG